MKNQLDRVNFLMNFDSKKTLNENTLDLLPNMMTHMFLIL